MRINFKSAVFIIIFFFALLNSRLKAEIDLPGIIDPEKTISMDLQEANLKDVLKIFSVQSGLNFIASEAVKDRKVTLYLNNVPIKETMVKLFNANRLIYEYDEDANIFIVTYAEDAQEPDMITKVFHLKYRSVAAANLEKEKINLFSGSAVTSGQMSSGIVSSAASAAGGATITDAIKQLLSKSGKVNEDASSNSLIVTDLVSRFPLIEKVISGLDQPQPQVMLEVEILDVSKNVMDNLGFTLGDITNSPNPLSLILRDHSKSNFFIGDLAKKGATLLTSDIAGSVVVGNYYATILNFLTQQQDTKYLARPRILTLNNETAEIGITKDEVMNLKRTRSTDSAGVSNIETTYDRATSLALTSEGIGIYLRVTPQINMDTGEITMVVNPKTSSASDKTEFGIGTDNYMFYRDPEVRSTKSIIKIKDGETVVLGGMIHQEKAEVKQKVPFLGDLPILGALFRNKNVSKNIERELLVFITPRIIRESAPKFAKKENFINRLPSAQAPLSRSDRRQEISDLLNSFERERNTNGQRKIPQVGGAFN